MNEKKELKNYFELYLFLIENKKYLDDIDFINLKYEIRKKIIEIGSEMERG